ncbi:hypothetical protein MKX03_031729 [Papaver bracteatum]|nr:hypothetical protein MKX03_031729 [Papaver bracteatum]
METLMSSSSSLLIQSNMNRSFSSPRSAPLLSTSNKPEFVSLFPASSHQKRSNHNYLSQAISLSRFKAIMGSVSSRSCSSKSSFYPQGNTADTEFPSQETLQTKTVKVSFQLIQECSYGQEFLVVGDDPILGAWDPSSAMPLKWSEGNLWKAELDVPIDKTIEFKFILKDPNTGEVIWHPCPNRVFQTWETKMIIVYEDCWDIVFGDWHILFEDWDKVGFLQTWVGFPNSNEKRLVAIQPLGSCTLSSPDVSSIRVDRLFESLWMDFIRVPMDELQ